MTTNAICDSRLRPSIERRENIIKDIIKTIRKLGMQIVDYSINMKCSEFDYGVTREYPYSQEIHTKALGVKVA